MYDLSDFLRILVYFRLFEATIQFDIHLVLNHKMERGDLVELMSSDME